MKKYLFSKIMVIGIIVLFFGVNISITATEPSICLFNMISTSATVLGQDICPFFCVSFLKIRRLKMRIKYETVN